MAQAEVIKIGIVGLAKNQDKILDVVYDFGEMQLVRGDEEQLGLNESLSQLEYKLAQLKFTLDFIARYAPDEKLSWRNKLSKAFSQGIAIKHDKLESLIKEFDFSRVVKQAEDLEEQINLKQSLVASLEAEIEELKPWQDLGFNYQDYISDKVAIKIGILEQAAYDDLLVKAGSRKLATEVRCLNPDERQKRVVLIFLKKNGQRLDEILSEVEFKEVSLPDLDDVPSQVILNKEVKIKKNKQEIDRLTAQAADLRQDEEKLKLIYDYLTWQYDKLQAAQLASQSQRTFNLVGFIARERLKVLEQRLNQVTKSIHLVEMPINEDEEVPVILSNSKLISPFESVTNIYGAPKSTELDPTPYLAPFFILFFGLCLSDAGYGLLLGALAYAAIKIMKIPRAKQGFFRLLIYAGISTFIIGALVGGWFGLVLEDLPQNGLTNLLLSIKIIDPVTNPLTMLVFSLILGGIQVIVGVTINMFYQLKRNDWGKAFDAALWLFFLLGLVFWLLATNVLDEAMLEQLGKYWIWSGAILLVLTQGRRQKNILLKLPLGVLSLYNLVGYFSDVMSYSRLLALGLSTGIIAMVINMVAVLFKDMIPLVGWLAAILILIGGHLFNLAINALGSFIHSGRLQYVEFFPKFMEGGGARFKPLKKTAKYIDLNSLKN